MSKVFQKGDRVHTSRGPGTIALLRMNPNSLSEASAYSVLLDERAGHLGYNGTIFTANQVRPALKVEEWKDWRPGAEPSPEHLRNQIADSDILQVSEDQPIFFSRGGDSLMLTTRDEDGQIRQYDCLVRRVRDAE